MKIKCIESDCKKHCVIECNNFDEAKDICCPFKILLKQCNGKFINTPFGIKYEVVES